MRYSLLTPTLCRSSPKRLCDSIDAQTSTSWEHIVIVDCDPSHEQRVIIESIQHPQRRIVRCSTQHKMDYGNTARREGFDLALGDYILQIDDDDYYADNEVFTTLERVTKPWAAFPVLARGIRCHHRPPALHLTGSAMFMYRRDTGCKFPENADYSADGQLVEELKRKFPYETLDDCRELVIYPKANHGRTQAEIDAWRPTLKTIKYAADGMTIDWHDQRTRG